MDDDSGIPEVQVVIQPTYIDGKVFNLVNMPGIVLERSDPQWHGEPFTRVFLASGQKWWLKDKWLSFNGERHEK